MKPISKVGTSVFLYCLFSINFPSEAFPSFFTGSSSSSSPFLLLLFSQLHFHALLHQRPPHLDAFVLFRFLFTAAHPSTTRLLGGEE